jgi:uridylate kinase
MDAPSETSRRPAYRRVLLKLSGEALGGDDGTGFDQTVLQLVASEVLEVTKHGVQVAIVVGGGNIARGSDLSKRLGIEEVTGHTMGMLATVINGLALMDTMERVGLVVRVQSSIEMRQVAEPFIRRRALRHLEKGRVVIFVGGTGSPYFSTDTAAALRAIEIEANALLMAKKGVSGVYDKDPRYHTDAVMYSHLDYMEILNRDLRVMDATAAALCKDNNMDIVVFDVARAGNIIRAVAGEYYGAPTPLQSLATVTAPEPRLLVVKPFDKGAVKDIERAILQSDLGFNPSFDGTIFRIPVPALTEERRRELVKVARRHAEEGRVSIRNIRREAKEMLEALEHDGEISEDESRRGVERLQELTDEMIAQLDHLLHTKEQEIMEV